MTSASPTESYTYVVQEQVVPAAPAKTDGQTCLNMVSLLNPKPQTLNPKPCKPKPKSIRGGDVLRREPTVVASGWAEGVHDEVKAQFPLGPGASRSQPYEGTSQVLKVGIPRIYVPQKNCRKTAKHIPLLSEARISQAASMWWGGGGGRDGCSKLGSVCPDVAA